MSEARTADFHVRMTPEERDRLDAAAAVCGLTRSELIRLLSQLPADKMSPGCARLVYVDRRAMARVHREMRRFGVNFNQAAHAMNAVALYLRRGALRDDFLAESLDTVRLRLSLTNELQERLCREVAELESAAFAR